jgi:iron complex outermembrane receptor protein
VTVRPHTLSGRTFATAGNEDGTYEIRNLPPGDYYVTVSFVGYTVEVFNLRIVADTDVARQDARLAPKVIDLNTISVTASRRPEKINDAPASVSVTSSESIKERTALTPTDHVSGQPGVDMARTGLNQTNMVTRGFNNIFSSALLVLTDNRMAGVPSLSFNAYNFIPTSDLDIDRIEIVSGPGSALYGPNSAAGVMHIITKSPFESEGTTVSVGGGERELMLGSFRHAGSVNNRFGYKISGQYYGGLDWKHAEPSEPPQVTKFRPSPDGPVYIGGQVSNARNYRIRKLATDARFDFLISENTSLIVNGGYNRSSGIELTGLSAGQAINWGYSYVQARMRYKDLFVQGYMNASDAGDTYLLQTGQMIVDRSRVWVGQVQHNYQPTDRWSFTYGADAIFTRPNTDYTINGRNENNDNVNEIGAYLQAEHKLLDHIELIGAARVDDHSRLKDLVFSPRAALVYQPDEHNSLRFTFNQAYATPDNNNLCLDILSLSDPFHTGIDIRVQGVPETGFHWRTDDAGPMFRSQFSPLIGGNPDDYYSLDMLSPQLTNAAWAAGVQLTRGGLISRLTTPTSEGGPGIDPATAAAIADAAVSVVPNTISSQGTVMRVLDLDSQQPIEVGAGYVEDIEALKPAITRTLELGYKGVLSDRIRFSVDAYRTNKHNFVGPLTIETPNVFMDIDPNTLAAEIVPAVGAAYASADPVTQARLNLLDQDGDGPVDELVTMFITGGASTALGTVTPEEAMNPTDVLVTYRNFGDIAFYGIDLAFAYHLNRHWEFGGTYSYISRNFFAKDADQLHDINLNTPRNKFGAFVQYSHPWRKLGAQSRVRYVDAFDMDTPFFGHRVDSYLLVDLNAGIDIASNTRFNLTVQNVLDNRHIEFVGAPKLGRLTIARITQTF